MRSEGGFVEIKPDNLLKNTILTFDLYEFKSDDYELFRCGSFPVTKDLVAEITEEKGRKFFVREAEIENFHSYRERYLNAQITGKGLTNLEKAELLISVGRNLMKELFTSILTQTHIDRCNDFVKSLMSFFGQCKDASKFLYVSIPSGFSLYHHSLNVGALSLSLAVQLDRFEPEDLKNLTLGALLHDIGMKSVPAKIVNKSGKLNHQEYILVKKHVMWGVRILEELYMLDPKTIAAVQDHHERVDGRGYPSRKKGDDIHEFGRIIAIADVFSAITSSRPYRQAVNPFPALKEMISFRADFDVQFLKVFIKLLGENQ